MSRYDDLRPLVDAWRAQSQTLYRNMQRLPDVLAARLGAYLGGPEAVADAGGVPQPVVAPCAACWDAARPDGRFSLIPYVEAPEWTPYVDGRFYFGLRVLLEGAASADHAPFFVLLSAACDGDSFLVRSDFGGAPFRIRLDEAAASDPLMAHIYAAMRDELAKPQTEQAERQAIGFRLERIPV